MTTDASSETSQDIVDTTSLLVSAGTGEPSSNSEPACLIVGDEPIVIPSAVLKSSAFHNSHLSHLLSGSTPRGDKLPRNEKGQVIVSHPNPNAFKRVLAHLANQRPLEGASLKDMCTQYEELMAELIHFRLPRKNLNLPVRLWTNQAWTDLSAFYALDAETEELLYKRPVAVQLAEGELPAPISTAEALTDAERDLFFSKWNALKEHEKPWLYKLDDVLVGIKSQTCGIYSPRFLEGKVIVYSLPSSFEPPPRPSKRGSAYPYLVRKEDDHFFIWFNPVFGLEVSSLIVSNDRGPRGRISSVSVQRHGTTGSQGWLYSSGTSSADGKKSDWCCYHPELSPPVKYNGMTRILKDMTLSQLDIRCIRFYSWGALMVSNKIDPVFAVISIDDVDLSRIYGPGIAVVVRGSSYPALSREDIDITVASDLSRVYLLMNGQLSSQPVTPMGTTTAKIVFDIYQASSGKAPRTKLAHCDISDGGPIGPEVLGELSSLGMLADFDPFTDLYRQARISQTLCGRFVAK